MQLTPAELAILEALCSRGRQEADADPGAIAAGDVVQIRPGVDPHWQTSLFLVCAIRDDGSISGQILRPHRSGAREAWYTFRPADLARIGNAPFPEPPANIRSMVYPEICPHCHLQQLRKPIQRETDFT